jgi:AAA+ ATPase superfamily predicted ATPase
MKANPGGRVAPENVFGRDRLIEAIWERLEQQCVLINAERRIGKTSIINKMVANPPEKWFPVFQDLERIHSAEDFAREVYDVIQKFLSRWKLVANAAERIYEDHEFGSVKKKTKKPWKRLLVSSIEDLTKQKGKTDKSLVMFWDEVPYMIDNIRKADGEQVAAEVLDTLRSLRQQHPDLRMVFTGSIGLHHVLANINEAHIATAPVNDMFAVEVTPLAPADAESLARHLIQGEELESSNVNEAAAVIAFEADCFPFYIHHIVNGLKMDRQTAEPENIQDLVGRHLVDANDPWELAHFRIRIPIYYASEDDSRLVQLILDALALSEQACSTTALLKEVNSQDDRFDDRDNLLRVLRLMERDHYLRRTPDGEYEFRFPLIRRWWKLDRGL